jgi:hypothetical protein
VVKNLALGSLYVFRYTLWNLGVFTSPKTRSQTSVLGKTNISESRELQIECHLLD